MATEIVFLSLKMTVSPTNLSDLFSSALCWFFFFKSRLLINEIQFTSEWQRLDLIDRIKSQRKRRINWHTKSTKKDANDT